MVKIPASGWSPRRAGSWLDGENMASCRIRRPGRAPVRPCGRGSAAWRHPPSFVARHGPGPGTDCKDRRLMRGERPGLGPLGSRALEGFARDAELGGGTLVAHRPLQVAISRAKTTGSLLAAAAGSSGPTPRG